MSVTHGPCCGLGGAGLLEGHLEGVQSGVVGVGGDGRGRRQALEGGVGLGVGRGGGHGGRGGVLGAVGAGGGGAAPQALHAAAQQVVLGLRERNRQHGEGGEEGGRRVRREGTGRGTGGHGRGVGRGVKGGLIEPSVGELAGNMCVQLSVIVP